MNTSKGLFTVGYHMSFLSFFVDRPRAIGARPGGWVGRGPAWMGGIGRVTAPSIGRRISSP